MKTPNLTLKHTLHGSVICDNNNKPLVKFVVSNFLGLCKAVEIKAHGHSIQLPVELIPLVIEALENIHENPSR